MCQRCQVQCECWRHQLIGPGACIRPKRPRPTDEQIRRLVEEAMKQEQIASPAAERAARKLWGDGEG